MTLINIDLIAYLPAACDKKTKRLDLSKVIDDNGYDLVKLSIRDGNKILGAITIDGEMAMNLSFVIDWITKEGFLSKLERREESVLLEESEKNRKDTMYM